MPLILYQAHGMRFTTHLLEIELTRFPSQLNFPYLYEPNTPHLDTNTSLGQYLKEIALREP